jgi:hypothetical protein
MLRYPGTVQVAGSVVLAFVVLVGCVPAREAPHARSAAQQPIEPACGADEAPLSATGLVVATSFERGTRARSRITNRGARTRIVSPQSISLCVGPCAGYWAQCEQRRTFDAPEPAVAVTLAPGETLELAVDATHGAPASSCEKIGLIAVLDVDDTRACAELGRWIASRY